MAPTRIVISAAPVREPIVIERDEDGGRRVEAVSRSSSVDTGGLDGRPYLTLTLYWGGSTQEGR